MESSGPILAALYGSGRSSMSPDKLGRYEVEAEIGDGAMGRVYRAYDPLARRRVALKTIKSELLSKETADEYVRRFRREAEAAGGLSHPNIVVIYDVGESFLVMELLEGETLLALLNRRGRLGLRETLEILIPVADAIDHAHRKGIVHRDIKPANIMVTPDRRPKLMDFGVVHMQSTTMTVAGQFLGSPLYMAPEQIASADVTPRSDVFSLAAVAYEMLTGRRAFEGQSITSIIYRVMNATPDPPRRWNLELPPHYDDVFARALAKDPAARYSTASEFASALDFKDFDESLRTAFDSADLAAEAQRTIAASAVPPGAFETQPLGARTLPPAPVPPAVRPPAPATIDRARRPIVVLLAVPLLLVVALGVAWPLRPRPEPAVSASPSAPVLRIESQPSGATAFVDERDVGRTPLTLHDVGVGRHTVRVTRDGFAPAQLSITVTPEPLPPLRFVLEAAVAPLRVTSEPAGSVVFLDDHEVGRTPLTGINVAPGRHVLRLERAGHQSWRTTFAAEIGKPVEVAATLDRVRRVVLPLTPTPAPPPREGDLVELGPDVVPPRKVSGTLANYPESARSKKLQGRITIALVVDEKGEPQDLEVVESAGGPLDEAVLKAVAKWRYEPARKDGVKVRVRIREWQSFELRER
jgi:TonB family protein